MLRKFWIAVTAVGVTGLIALSAPSAMAQPAKPAADKPMSDMKSMGHHKMSCYDYAWESQQMKDCLDKKGGKKSMGHKAPATKKPAAKKSP